MEKEDFKKSAVISKVRLVKLFGKYTYEIQRKDLEFQNQSNILILYGGNGSGKTTILKLLYHLLSPNKRKGHKTFVANSKFKKIKIILEDKTFISAERKNGELIGSYHLLIGTNNKTFIELYLKADFNDGEYRIDVEGKMEEKLDKILKFLSELNIALYFLSDSRDFESNIFESKEKITEKKYISLDSFSRGYSREGVRISKEKISNVLIKKAIVRAERWINLQVNLSMSKGEMDVNKIYTKIIESLSRYPKMEDIKFENIEILLDILKKLASRSEDYSKFNIITSIEVDEIVSSLIKAPNEAYGTLNVVLKPYIEGIGAKLNALEKIYNILETFTNNLNSFYIDKEIEFKLNTGLQIKAGNIILEPEQLSSGEKQLLLLFCNILPARDYNSIFIIDEPEISLNVKWQRKLIQALLDLTKGSQIQFILATHSIELLTQFDNFVVDLINLD